VVYVVSAILLTGSLDIASVENDFSVRCKHRDLALLYATYTGLYKFPDPFVSAVLAHSDPRATTGLDTEFAEP